MNEEEFLNQCEMVGRRAGNILGICMLGFMSYISGYAAYRLIMMDSFYSTEMSYLIKAYCISFSIIVSIAFLVSLVRYSYNEFKK